MGLLEWNVELEKLKTVFVVVVVAVAVVVAQDLQLDNFATGTCSDLKRSD